MRNFSSTLLASAAFLALVALGAETASATAVPLINPSFEDPPPGGVWPFPRWIVPGGQSDSVGDGDQNGAVTGWTGGPGFVERNPTSYEFPGAAGNGALPSPADGSQAAFNTLTSNTDIAVLTNTGQPVITLQADKVYTLTVAFGQALNDPAGLGHFAGFGLEVTTMDGALIGLTASPADYPAPGTFKDFVLQFNSDDYIGSLGENGPWAGDVLRVGIILGAGTYADNVRLDISDVPEPSMLVLLASGLIGLSAYAWRWRKGPRRSHRWGDFRVVVPLDRRNFANSALASAAFLVLVALCAETALATAVPLINPSFEDPFPGGFWPFPRWNFPGGYSDSVGDGSQNSAVTGWTGGPDFVEWNPTSAEFPGAAGNGTLPFPADGSQAAFNISTFDNDIAVLDDPQVQPAITLQPHKIYTLTVAFGQALHDPVGYFAGFALQVTTMETALISLMPSPADYPAPGTFKDFVLQFNSDDYIGSLGENGPWAGDLLRAGFVLGAGTYADNVRLDISDVPEPSMLLLLASGLIGLSAYGWRRRTKTL